MGVWLLAPADLAAQSQPDLKTVLSKIELRYNSLATLRLDFEHTLTYLQRRPRRETGTLLLYRPQRMRWDYSQPEGKVLVGDGDVLQMYNPLTNQVTRAAMEQTGDLRAPLAFLLGRLRFRRQFRNLRLEEVAGRTILVAEGRPRDAYHRVEFTYDPRDFRLLYLKVFGRDESVTAFRFDNEVVNPRLELSRFEFRPPPGAEIVDEAGYREVR